MADISLADMEQMAEYIVASRLFGVQDKAQAMTLMLLAQAERMHPMAAIQDFDIIKGRPARKTHSILARFQSAGGVVEWEQISKKRACGTFAHKSGGSLKVEWTIETANEIGITQAWDKEKREWKTKDNWANYPQAMLRARCIAEGVRAVYPAAIGGNLSVEEAQDLDVIEMEPTKPPVEQPRAKSERPALENKPTDDANFDTVADSKEPEKVRRQGGKPLSQREPGSDDDMPLGRDGKPTDKKASKSAIHVVEIKLEQAGLTTKDLETRFGFGLQEISLGTINHVLQWISNPTTS